MDAFNHEPASDFIPRSDDVIKNELRSRKCSPPILIELSHIGKSRFNARVAMQDYVLTVKLKVLWQVAAIPIVNRLLDGSLIRFSKSVLIPVSDSLRRAPRASIYLIFTFAISGFGVNASPKSSTSITLRISTSASPFEERFGARFTHSIASSSDFT